MEPITECQVDLFAENLPSIDEIRQLSDHVHSSELNKLEFADQLEANISKTSPKAALAAGIGLYLLGRYADAAEKLNKAADTKEKYIYLACALRKIGDFKSAIAALDKSLKHDADSLTITLERASTYRQASDLDACEKELSSCTNFKNVNAEYHYQLARMKEARGLYLKACEDYKAALELQVDHQRALFHLAFCCDLAGDEQAAIDYYLQIVANHPVYVNAMLNLAVLYEDAGEFDKASNYINKVLQAHPNHPRARLFEKDIDSSKTMFYDEEKEKKRTRKTQILETPISDFELSVRSRNCLKKMNIYTIGDLLNITESELLSYKNFGETSLREIKIILDSKGLYLGMDLEQKHAIPSDLSDHHTPQDEGLLSKPVEDLQLSVRARKCLQRLTLRSIGELTQKTEAELLGCKNFGVTSLNEIKKALTNMGLSLRNLD